ncbi:hypothetical protein QWY84_11930 [Aquisalimonas lutea]|uniref:hypothetical protein n=1 Tax=Aquisalimonas lutea TaxID=1327750 RepID=UPI0025B4A0BA|nr:hypothetical protein [Aquisalimonas lutea]MDN3518323.1 hypothetical protein [Aquisalimonas lutea]
MENPGQLLEELQRQCLTLAAADGIDWHGIINAYNVRIVDDRYLVFEDGPMPLRNVRHVTVLAVHLALVADTLRHHSPHSEAAATCRAEINRLQGELELTIGFPAAEDQGVGALVNDTGTALALAYRRRQQQRGFAEIPNAERHKDAEARKREWREADEQIRSESPHLTTKTDRARAIQKRLGETATIDTITRALPHLEN